MKVSELIEKLEQADGDSEAAEALKEHAQPVYQAAFDAGHGVATRSEKSKSEKLQKDLEASEAKVAEREERIRQLEEDKPDVAKIHAEYREQIDELKSAHEQQLTEERAGRRKDRLARAKSDLRSLLVSGRIGERELHIDPDYADVMADRHEGRLAFDEEGRLQVLQQGKEIPVQVADGKSPLEVLALEIDGAAPAKFKASGADRGSEARGGPAGAGDSNTYDRIRQRVKAEREAKTQGPSLDERMGIAQSA